MRTFGDLMMNGNPNSTCRGIIEPTIVVVDPVGCVVTSPGVRVISHLGRRLTRADVVLATQLINMGPQRALEIKAKLDEPAYPKPERKSMRKGKQRLKGLRP